VGLRPPSRIEQFKEPTESHIKLTTPGQSYVMRRKPTGTPAPWCACNCVSFGF